MADSVNNRSNLGYHQLNITSKSSKRMFVIALVKQINSSAHTGRHTILSIFFAFSFFSTLFGYINRF